MPTPNSHRGLVRDCETLLASKRALAGDAHLNWSDTISIWNWDGVYIGHEPPRVVELSLGFRGLSGVVPANLGRLTALERINLTDNRLSGSIPAELGRLTKLRGLDLGVNRLTGEIPSELGDLTKLRRFDVAQNRLTGEIPSELGNLTRLTEFIVGANYLTGDFPAELAQLNNLSALFVDGNQLTGCVPVSMRAPTARLGSLRFCSDLMDLWAEIPTFEGGVDLSITFIERLPRYQRHKVAYASGPSNCLYPFDEFIGAVGCPEQEGIKGIKRWPQSGQMVELVAHVRNFGDVHSPAFTYEWAEDGKTINANVHQGLGAGEWDEIRMSWEWTESGSYPLITFTVDPNNDIEEILEDNNSVDDWIKGLTLGIYFSPTSYESLTLANTPDRHFQSPEQWVHAHATYLNDLLAKAGVSDRIRLEQFYVTDERYVPSDLYWYLDGWWDIWHQFPIYTPDGYRDRPDTDLGLLHEWMHQLGIIDLYVMITGEHHVLLPDANRPGRSAGCGRPYTHSEIECFLLPDDVNDLMTYTLPKVGTHSAGALKANSGHRRGFYGEYLYDTPDTTLVRIIDKSGQPVPGTTLRFYQKGYSDQGEHLIDAIPEFSVTSDADGLALLPKRGVAGVRTATGHLLRPNPFGIIDVGGANGVFLIEMVSDECTNYEWLTIVELNLAYWDGQTEQAEFTKILRCPPPR